MKRFLVAVLAAALCAGINAQAQTYPAKAVRIIVPFAAGGPADIYARFIGQRLSEALGQPFVIEDRPGAGSVIGTAPASTWPVEPSMVTISPRFSTTLPACMVCAL